MILLFRDILEVASFNSSDEIRVNSELESGVIEQIPCEEESARPESAEDEIIANISSTGYINQFISFRMTSISL